MHTEIYEEKSRATQCIVVDRYWYCEIYWKWTANNIFALTFSVKWFFLKKISKHKILSLKYHFSLTHKFHIYFQFINNNDKFQHEEFHSTAVNNRQQFVHAPTIVINLDNCESLLQVQYGSSLTYRSMWLVCWNTIELSCM